MVIWYSTEHAGVRSVLRSGDSSAVETKGSLCQRNCCSTESINTKEGIVSGTSAFTTVAGAEGLVLCTVEAGGSAIDCSSAKLLSATFD